MSIESQMNRLKAFMTTPECQEVIHDPEFVDIGANLIINTVTSGIPFDRAIVGLTQVVAGLTLMLRQDHIADKIISQALEKE